MPVPAKKLSALIDKDRDENTKKLKRMPPRQKGKPPKDDDENEHGHEDDKPEVDVDEVAKAYNDGEFDDDDEVSGMEGYDPGEGENNPPSWVDDEDTWEKAKKATDPEGDGQKYDEPYAVTAAVYKRMGGKVKSKGKRDED